MTFKDSLKKLMPDIVNIRHQLHAYPELAFNEIKTSELISKTLKDFG
jgi:hippurate hydrolase